MNLPGHDAVKVGVEAVALYEWMRRFMDHRHGNPVHASAALLFQNAVNFGRPASDAADGNDVVYRIAIAVELLLKACLAAAGIPDTVRTAIGHDLRVAASLAQALGLDLPAGHGNLLRHIHPHFRDGGFHRYPARRWSDAFVRDARTIIGQLTEHVEAYIQNGDHRHEQLRAGIVDRLPPAASEIFRRAVAGDTLTDIAALMHLTPAYVERTLTAAVRSIDVYVAESAGIDPT